MNTYSYNNGCSIPSRREREGFIYHEQAYQDSHYYRCHCRIGSAASRHRVCWVRQLPGLGALILIELTIFS